MDYTIIDQPEYGGRLNVNIYNSVILYYTKKQMRGLYPNMNIWIAGEINNKTGIQCGTVENLDAMPFPIYRLGSHNKMTEKIVGYVCVDGFRFLAVVKNVFILRLLLLMFSASLFYGILYHLTLLS